MRSATIFPPVLLILLIAFTVRLYLLIALPLYPDKGILPGYNDEPLHLHYVEHIASGGEWPTWIASPDSLNYLTDAYVHPPLYYSIGVPFFRLGEKINDGLGLYSVRLLSIILGLIAGLFIYRTTLLLFNDRYTAISALAIALLAPNAVFFTSIVTNDALLYCLSALTLHSLVICHRGGCNALRQVITGSFIAASIWSKMSGLTLLPLAWFAAAPSGAKEQRWRSKARVFIVAVMLIMPLVARNIINYGQPVPGQQKPLADQYWPEKAVGVAGGAVLHPVQAVKTCLRLAAVPLMDLWGSRLEKGTSAIWLAFWGIVLLTGLISILLKPPRDYLLPAALGCVILGFIWHNIHLYQVEFRLLMPAFPALAVISARGAGSLKLPIAIQIILLLMPTVLLTFFH